jgi:hypothetical protein
MNRSSIFSLLLTIVVGISLPAAASPQILVPEFPPETNGLFSGWLPFVNLPQEVNLPVALFQETNLTFDTKIYESVRKTTKAPVVLSFLLITFIFSSPSTNDPVYSFCEMGQPDELVCTGTNVYRRPGSTNEIPLIRVSTVDRHKKEVTADLDLLIGIAPLENPQDVRYFRRSFRFVFRHGWRED